MLNPDDLIEIFVSLIILLVGLAAIVQIQLGTDITPLINVIIEFLVPIFLGVFVLVVLANMVSDIFN